MSKIVQPLKWHGGKSYLGPWIHSLAPPHKHRVYLYAGGLGEAWTWPHEGVSEVANDLNGYLCLAPSTRLLTSDLRWKPIGEFKVGDRVLAFDEHNGPTPIGQKAPSTYRRFRNGTVTETRLIQKPCYKMTFDDGTVVTASADHQWLAGSQAREGGGGHSWRWRTTEEMSCGAYDSWVMKAVSVVEQETTWDAGWMAGFADGEASIAVGPGLRVDIHQAVGPQIDRAEEIIRTRGFEVYRRSVLKHSPAHYREMASLSIGGGLHEQLRFLMTFRPGRLIDNFSARVGQVSLYGRDKRPVLLVEKQFIGEQEVVALETDTRTYIAEGLASHNCNFYRVLQDPKKFDELHRRLSATPFAREEWVGAHILMTEFLKNYPADEARKLVNVELAAMFFVWNRQSMGGRMKGFTPLTRARTRGGRNAEVNAWWGAVEGLPEVRRRLDNFVIEQDNALAVIDREDTKDTLFYADPAYLMTDTDGEGRTTADVYHCETAVAHHELLLQRLTGKKLKGKFMLSGYASKLYAKYLTPKAGWTKHTKVIDNKVQKGPAKRKMTECLWCNF